MKKIPLSRGAYAVVSEEHFPILNQFKWYAAKGSKSRTLYASREHFPNGVQGGKVNVHMHREVLSLILGRPLTRLEYPDHRDGDGLNNLPSNLRLATHAQNMQNKRPNENSTSRYKGVNWDVSRGKWLSRIRLEERQKNLGRYDSEVEAAQAYDRAAKGAWGEFAYLNFPDS